jgi:4-hydroxy-tetrahydrodipicolinate reductase
MGRTRVLVHGALGKMGQEVLRALCHDPDLEPVAGVDIKAASRSILLPDGSRSIPLSTDLDATLGHHDIEVIVDFTSAEATMAAVRAAAEHMVPMVIGTTGLSTEQVDEITSLCKKQELGAVIASNFSIAAAVMIQSAKLAARFFDHAEIIELHHEQKTDAPSGTALTTAKKMAEARGKPFVHATPEIESIPGSRGGDYEGIAIHSVRLPGLLSHQEIILGAPGQTLTIRLDQIGREAFMPSVLLAIRRVTELKAAVVGLDSILGLEEGNCQATWL